MKWWPWRKRVKEPVDDTQFTFGTLAWMERDEGSGASSSTTERHPGRPSGPRT